MQHQPQQHQHHQQQQQRAVLVPFVDPGLTPTTRAHVHPSYASKTARMSGVAQIMLGLAAIFIEAMLIGLHTGFAKVSGGIWCGIMVRLICFILLLDCCFAIQ